MIGQRKNKSLQLCLHWENDDWLNQFGNIIMMQKPEDMELFPAEEKGYSYIILFDDYNKIDLTLLPLEELGNYLNDDKLIKIILDKDGPTWIII